MTDQVLAKDKKNINNKGEINMRVQFQEMTDEFKRILIKKGFSETDAEESAEIFTQNSVDGIYSHGVNRFPRVVEYIDKGHILTGEKASKVLGIGPMERWDGNKGMGNLNAKICMDRTIELSKEHGIGIVALSNTNHWMRGGTYGWQAANDGCIGICWTNTMPNMPAWGGKDSKIGNNPLVFAIPRSHGEHVVVDMAMSQFSYGKIEEYKLKSKQLPIAGGFNKQGEITTDPKEIEETSRVLPVGFWKGSGLSIALDLIATVLSGGLSTTEIGKQSEDEYGISQIFISIDPTKFSDRETIDAMINTVLEDIKQSELADDAQPVLYPGERVISTRKENMSNGIPVRDDIWNKIKQM